MPIELGLIKLNQLLFDSVDSATGSLKADVTTGTATPITYGNIFNNPGPVANEGATAVAIKLNNVLAKVSDGEHINAVVLP